MSQPRRGALPSQILVYTLVNIPVSMVISFPLLQRAFADPEPPTLGNLLMFLSTFSSLNLAYFLVLLLLALVRVPRALIIGLAVAVGSFLQILLIADVRIFGFFKFHINGLVLNFLTTEGAGESLKLGTQTLLTYGLACFAIVAAQGFLAKMVFFSPDSFPTLRRHGWGLLAALLSVVLLDKATYAYADLTDSAPVLSAARYYPWYVRVTVKRMARKWFGYELDRGDNPAIHRAGSVLNYPLQPLTFSNDKPRYNVVTLVADGFRADMLSPDVTPRTFEFGQQNLLFENHFSGGNGTRCGIFSLVYGLYGTLWHAFLETRRGPVLIDGLKDLGYQFFILSPTPLTFPEFRKTAFVQIPDSVSDQRSEEDNPARDRGMVEDLHQFLEKRDRNTPFFVFALFNSTHAFYQYPPEFEKFSPVCDPTVNYMSDFSPETIEGLRNRYKNGLYYIDSLWGAVIDDLHKHDAIENTIVILTGDHGEEFGENGYYSHNSAFDDYQVKTAFVARIPGESPRRVSALTSHLDVAPTILGRVGCNNPPSDYSHGRDLLSSEPRSFVFATDWGAGAIITENERAVIPVDSGALPIMEVRTAKSYEPIQDPEVVGKCKRMLGEVAIEMGRFLR
jgi:hypothetical protein